MENPFGLKRDNLAWRQFWRMITGQTCIIDWNDETHAHCIDCGKLYKKPQMSCDRCGGFVDWCDGRCLIPATMNYFKARGIRWEEYTPEKLKVPGDTEE